jgi:anti-anti-sigma factor
MLVYRDEAKKAIYVTPDRDLAADEAQAMRRELLGCIWQGTETLVLDLARVQTIDAIGLETIIAAYNWIRKSGGELIIENASRELKDLFGLMRTDGHLTISRTGWSR